MRFQVPQFIEVEDKIFGPLTFKQFIYVAGSFGICAVAFTLLPKFLAFFVSVPVAGLGVALAFFKVNERPFAMMIENFFKFHTSGKLYIWKKSAPPKVSAAEVAAGESLNQLHVPKLSGSRLRDLTFELDVKQQTNPVTNDKL